MPITPEGGTLRISIGPCANGEIEVRVADTGIGISGSDIPQIFTPFFSTKPAGRGSGLGLVVAAGIVADHGGHIDVQSEPGCGTVFVIGFPADAQEASEPSTA